MNSRSTTRQSDFWRLALRYCLGVFLPLALLIVAGSWFLLRSERARLEARLLMDESTPVRLGAGALVSQLQQVGGDVRYLARLESLAAVLNQADSLSMARLTRDFQSFAEAKGIYDRLRWLDENGMERLRVELVAGKGVVTPDSALQDKSKHRHFHRAIALEPGQLYVSPLELSVERGQVETPYKPTLYLAMPVFDTQGAKRGIVLVNYHGEHLLGHFRAVSAGQSASLALLNQDGYWLVTSPATDEWGFMFGRTETFARRHPPVWRRILVQDEGQFRDVDGVWTFATVYPLQGMQSSEGRAVVSPSSLETADESYAWKVVSHLPPERLPLDHTFLIQILSAGCIIFILLGLGVARLVYTHLRLQRTTLQLRALNQRLSTEAAQRRQAVAELRISEERFDFALRASHEGLWDWDLTTDGVFYSSRWKAMLGYRDDELENECATWRRLIDPADLSRVDMLTRDCAAGQQPGFSVEFRMRHKDGYWVDILSRGILVRDETGHPKRLVGTHMDISERRQMERDLSEAQRIAQVGYWRYEPSTNRLSWSDEVYRIFELNPMTFGTTYEFYLGMIYPADRAVVDREYQNHLKWNTPYRIEYRLLLPDGRVKHILSRCDTERDESGVALRSLGTVQDITREKETERRLRASEACVNHIIDAVPEVILVVDQDGHIERVNARVEQIFGYERSALLGEVVEVLIPHDCRDRHPVLRQQFSAEGGLAYRMGKGRELFGLHKDGREIPVEIWLSTLPTGKDRHVVVSIVDISDRKAAERALRDSEERLRLMTSCIRDYAIFMLDPQGLVVSWNEGAQRLKGYQADEIIGQSLARFHPPEEAAAGRPAMLLKQAETEGYAEIEGWRQRKDGSTFFADVIIAAIRDERGALIGFSKITRDITERKVAEERLRIEREQQETLRALLEICMSGTTLEDTLGQCLQRLLAVSWLQPLPEGGIFLADSKAQQLHLVVSHSLDSDVRDLCANVAWGYCHCGRAAAEQKIQYAQHVDERHAITFLGMPDHGHYSVPIVSHGDLMGVLVVTLTVDFQQDTVKEQFLGATADILASYLSRERAEAEVAQHHERLEMLVAERTVDLEKARLEAEQLARVKDTFLATMSHEIRTPMNALLGMLELVGLHGLGEQQARMLDTAQESGQSLLRIIDDILDYSKIEAGKLTIVAEPASIAEIVQLAAAFYERLASSKGLVLIHAVSPEISPLVSVDRLRLRQILNNFLSNAIKFTERGRVELRAELIEHLQGMDRVRFTVVDTGVGIATEVQQLLFQPFSQADAETTRRFGGTGLGLAICRRLADMMNGDIELTSVLGQGTALSLTLNLPVLDVTVTQAATSTASAFLRSRVAGAPHPVTVTSATGKLILLVDDHPTNRDLLTQQLEILGFASEQAVGGIKALEMWKTREYDLLITDCHMPEVDGYQLVREIRRLEAKIGRRRMPVLAWTANALKESAGRCLSAGMDDVLIKPANLESLRAKLNQLFSTSIGDMPTVAALSPAPVVEADVPQDRVLDRTILFELTGGDPKMESEILARFHAANQSDAQSLERAIANRDATAVTYLAHRMSGAAKMIGAQLFAQSCEALEQAGKSACWPDIEVTHQQRYLSALVQLRQALNAL
ncbi:MAG: PAS domain S-box protein [Candidatus Competibacteraceae bacterium]|nr:MAG: PAS domain S-box protein [Candidatus Competibacteraceae bacterium]